MCFPFNLIKNQLHEQDRIVIAKNSNNHDLTWDNKSGFYHQFDQFKPNFKEKNFSFKEYINYQKQFATFSSIYLLRI